MRNRSTKTAFEAPGSVRGRMSAPGSSRGHSPRRTRPVPERYSGGPGRRPRPAPTASNTSTQSHDQPPREGGDLNPQQKKAPAATGASRTDPRPPSDCSLALTRGKGGCVLRPEFTADNGLTATAASPQTAGLPADPLVRAVSDRGGLARLLPARDIDREHRRLARAYHRAVQHGRLSYFAADELACRMLRCHPVELWGPEFWRGAS